MELTEIIYNIGEKDWLYRFHGEESEGGITLLNREIWWKRHLSHRYEIYLDRLIPRPVENYIGPENNLTIGWRVRLSQFVRGERITSAPAQIMGLDFDYSPNVPPYCKALRIVSDIMDNVESITPENEL
jgi:hypothetical protein